MRENKKTVSVLNGLVEINNDRIHGYEKAASELKEEDVDLKAIFEYMKSNSEKHIRKLSEMIISLGGQVEKGTTLAGKVYRGWMDLKAAISRNEKATVLESCVFGEKVAQKAYEFALDKEHELDNETMELITSQKSALHNDYKKMVALEKAQKVLS